ncbi:MAG: thiamine ABC transporter substrate-binding protein [archaeon]|nr:thiamine ABC transporter substrate-binding protein [archaeon]
MNKISIILLFSFIIFSGCVQQPQNDLTIYTYDSMVSEYGLGPQVVPQFEEKCNCKVNMVSKGDAGQVLSALILEKDNPKADLVIGLDNSLIFDALKHGVLEEFTPKNASLVSEKIKFSQENYLVPYDYGYFAFVYNSEAVNIEINSFDSLLDSSLKNKIAIQNPRTSSSGLGLLLWTIAVYGDPGYKDFWIEFKPNILTITDGWDESAGLFAAKEVPIYLSYGTSPPYYKEFEDIDTYLAADFKEGHYVQIEGMGIVKGTKNRKLAEQFIEFSLTEEFQSEVPFKQFMFPVNKNIELPQAFEDYALQPETQLELNPVLVDEKKEEWISEWEKIMQS